MSRSTRKPGRVAAQTLDAIGDGVLSPALRRFFDAMASHFPGHVMQRLMRVDGSVRYTYVSPGVTALGLDPHEVLLADNSPQDWLHPDDMARWRAALATSAAALTTLDEEVRVIGKDGNVRWVRSIGNPRRLENGDTVWDGVALDVTDKREALDALRLAKEHAAASEAHKARILAAMRAALEDLSWHLRRHRGARDNGADELRAALEAADLIVERSIAMLEGGAEPDTVEPTYDRLSALTSRQRDVLELLGLGCSNLEIARRLGITYGTAKLHVAALLKALGLANRSQATALVARQGLRRSADAP